jgi:hypothetical protein
MWKWKWQALASVARSLSERDHPYLAAGLLALAILTPSVLAVTLALLE